MSDPLVDPVATAQRRTVSAINLSVGATTVAAGLWAASSGAIPWTGFLFMLLAMFYGLSAPVFLPASSNWLGKACMSAFSFVVFFLLWKLVPFPFESGTGSMVMGMAGGLFVGRELNGSPDGLLTRRQARLAVAAMAALCGLVLAWILAR